MKSALQDAVKVALKARDKVRLDTLRTVLSAIQYEEMDKKVDVLPTEGIVAVLQREAKRRKEEIDFAEQANRPDLKEKFAAEMKIIEEFLPKQLAPQDLEKILIELKSASPGLNMGAAMKALKESHGGQYDGKLASEIAKKVLG